MRLSEEFKEGRRVIDCLLQPVGLHLPEVLGWLRQWQQLDQHTEAFGVHHVLALELDNGQDKQGSIQLAERAMKFTCAELGVAYGPFRPQIIGELVLRLGFLIVAEASA